MKSRRFFLTNTTLAATALVFCRPLKGFSTASLFTESGSANKIIFLHYGNNPKYSDYATEKITAISQKNPAAIQIPGVNEAFDGDQFKIIKKGGIRTGLIRVTGQSSIKEINELARRLKSDLQCQLVICLSALGFRQKKGCDDLQLAEKSDAIDIIIGNHASNHTCNAFIARNLNRNEVIIHHAADNGFGLGSIEISFDKKTPTKCAVAINNHLTRLPENA